jgi:hypothetical protein
MTGDYIMSVKTFFQELFGIKQNDEFKHLEELKSHPKHDDGKDMHLHKPTKDIVNEINAPAKKSIFDLQEELNSIKPKIISLEAKVAKTKNAYLLKEYSKELKEFKRKKIMIETSMDARKRKL